MLQYNPSISGSLSVTGSLIVTNGVIGTVNGVDIQIFSSSISQVVTNIQTTTGSQSGRLTSIESFTSSVSTTNTFTASASARLSSIETVSASNISRLNAVETITASNISRLNSIETITASNISRLTSLEITTGSLATTGSNTFIGTQTITGSLFISSDLIVQGSSSLQNITASAVSIGTNIIYLNTDTPAVRFAGLTVQDSGSSAGVTGSMLWDSLCNRWIYSNPSTIGYSGGMLLSGPRTQTLGTEPTLTCNYVAKSGGGDHLYDSCIIDDGITTCIKNNLVGTGTACFGSTILTSDSLLIGTNSTATGAKVYACNNAAVIFRAESTEDQAGLRLIAGCTSLNRASRIDFLNGATSRTTPQWTIINDYNQNGTNDLSIVSCDPSVRPFKMFQSGIACFSNDIGVQGNGWFKGTGNYNTVNVDSSTATGGGGVYVRQNGVVAGGIGVSGWYDGNTACDMLIVSETGRNMRFYTNSANERMRITSAGNILATGGRISNARCSGGWQEWVAKGLTITNNSALALFCINGQYDNLIVELAAWVDQGAWSVVSYKYNVGYNAGSSYTAILGAASSICGITAGTTYNETWCWKNCSGGNINNSAISLRIFGMNTQNSVSNGGADLIISNYLTRIS